MARAEIALNKERKSSSDGRVANRRAELLLYISERPDRPMKLRALGRALDIADEDYADFRALVRDMLEAGELALGPGRSLVLPQRGSQVVGVFRGNRRGFGFVESQGRPDLFVPRDHVNGALDGDTVAVRVVRRRGAEPYAEVTRVVARATTAWVGELERIGGVWLVRPRGKSASPPAHIDDPTACGAQLGDLVVVAPLAHTLGERRIRGVIRERLGPASDPKARVLAVVRVHGLPDHFPAEVIKEAEDSAQLFDDRAFRGREDLRDLQTITIDPPDARDFDDAISVEELGDGVTRLGVHIADVAHFVSPDGALDNVARQRGVSVYFPGLVLPMLPQALSNGVCSLQPGVPRLTKSVFIDYDSTARVVATRFANSVIRSRARLTYEQASAALEGKAGGLDEGTRDLLERASRLAKRIRRRRLKNGMIVLSLPEIELRFGADGRVVDAQPADTSFSHTLIEMFMVEANEAVCRALTAADLPHLRRVHPAPEPEAPKPLTRLVSTLGLPSLGKLSRATIRSTLEAAAGMHSERIVSYALLRSLPQAHYSPEREGHFALASEHYAHFTSPIRRYPDLIAHRALDVLIQGGAGRNEEDTDDLNEFGRRLSIAERRALDAEREARQSLLLQFMKSKLGQTFPALVVSVAPFGVFVQIWPHLAEGLIRVSDMGPTRWRFDENEGTLIDPSGAIVSAGDEFKVKLVSVDDVFEEMNFAPANDRIGRRQASAPTKQTLKRKSLRKKK